MATRPKTKAETLAWLRTIAGELSTQTLKRLEDTLPWYGDMPPSRRSAVGLVAQAGIAARLLEGHDLSPGDLLPPSGEAVLTQAVEGERRVDATDLRA